MTTTKNYHIEYNEGDNVEEPKTCVICHDLIIQHKDKWVRLTDFDRGKEMGEVFNHLDCWKERFQITNSERKQKMIKQTMQALRGIKDNLGRGGIATQ